jgi:N-formylglutamate deformylase
VKPPPKVFGAACAGAACAGDAASAAPSTAAATVAPTRTACRLFLTSTMDTPNPSRTVSSPLPRGALFHVDLRRCKGVRITTVHEVFHGDPASGVVLHVPHSSTHVPASARRHIGLGDAELAAELGHITDAHTDVIAELAAARAAVRPHRFVNRLSRLVVDPERFPDEREEMAAVGMGAVYTRTTHGEPLRAADSDHEADLLATYFHPYAAAMTSTVDERLAAAGSVTLIDVHSYPSRALPYELHKHGARPAVCLGTDPFHTPPGLLAAARAAFPETVENTPFSGCYVPLKHYRRDNRVTAIMIEIRRDTYMREPGGPPHDGLDAVVAGLADLISRLGPR